MLAKTFGSAVQGVDAYMVTVELNIMNGTGHIMVGLPDNAVKESFWRVSSAIKENGFDTGFTVK